MLIEIIIVKVYELLKNLSNPQIHDIEMIICDEIFFRFNLNVWVWQ